MISGAGLTTMLAVAVAVAPAVSVACTPKEAVPAVTGVPDMIPDALIDKPCGNEPEFTVHV